MKMMLLLVFFVVSFFPIKAFSEGNDGVRHEKPVVGWLEKVIIFPGKFHLKAKIDTGAKSSSINAPHIVTFERNGKRWVSFDLADNENKKVVKVEKRIHRTTSIKRKGAEAQERLVIRMFMCLGDDYKEIEMNLADRRGFNHQILIGRDDLVNIFNVDIDPSAKYIRDPTCVLPESGIPDPTDQTE